MNLSNIVFHARFEGPRATREDDAFSMSVTENAEYKIVFATG
jgi:hypothetical protein